MSTMHIATTDTFFVDALRMEAWCSICGHTGQQEIGWIGMRCSRCRSVTNPEDTWPDVVMARRKMLGLTRRQMGEITGFAASTIKRYEFVRCTQSYIDATERAVRERFNPSEP